MIASLRGRVVSSAVGVTVLDVGGVGYRLATTTTASRRAAAGGDREVTLLTHLHVREDTLQLFGFASEAERSLFEMLLGVSGVGPKAALAIVSGYDPDQIRRAVQSGDHALFTSINGIGRRTAERVVIDLKDKVGGLVIPASGTDVPAPAGNGHTAARDALVGLGMSVAEAEAALRPIDDTLPVEERVRLALSGAVPAGAGG
jgi:holliday junction DNA helicase RuvA